MVLAGMLRTGGDALFCDLAEVYGVLEPRALGAQTLAMLANGLPDDARVRRAASGTRAKTDTLLLAQLVDLVGLLVWRLSGSPDAARPQSLAALLLGTQEDAQDVCGFETAQDFEAARQAILKGGERYGD